MPVSDLCRRLAIYNQFGFFALLMRNTITTILFIAAFIFGAITTYSQCSCVKDLYFAYDEFKYSDTVFVGKVVNTKKILDSKNTDKTTDIDYYDFQVTFEVKTAWKNDLNETITITNTGSDKSDFEIGESYLVYARVRYKDEIVLRAHTGCCTNTKRLNEAKKDLQEFEAKGEKPKRIIKKAASN